MSDDKCLMCRASSSKCHGPAYICIRGICRWLPGTLSCDRICCGSAGFWIQDAGCRMQECSRRCHRHRSQSITKRCGFDDVTLSKDDGFISVCKMLSHALSSAPWHHHPTNPVPVPVPPPVLYHVLGCLCAHQHQHQHHSRDDVAGDDKRTWFCSWLSVFPSAPSVPPSSSPAFLAKSVCWLALHKFQRSSVRRIMKISCKWAWNIFSISVSQSGSQRWPARQMSAYELKCLMMRILFPFPRPQSAFSLVWRKICSICLWQHFVYISHRIIVSDLQFAKRSTDDPNSHSN